MLLLQCSYSFGATTPLMLLLLWCCHFAVKFFLSTRCCYSFSIVTPSMMLLLRCCYSVVKIFLSTRCCYSFGAVTPPMLLLVWCCYFVAKFFLSTDVVTPLMSLHHQCGYSSIVVNPPGKFQVCPRTHFTTLTSNSFETT